MSTYLGLLDSKYPNSIFDCSQLYDLEKDCERPILEGDIEVSLEYTFLWKTQSAGNFRLWKFPDSENISNRYLVIAIVGNEGNVPHHEILVIDRYSLMYGGVEEVVAEWNGCCALSELCNKMICTSNYYKNAHLIVYANKGNTYGNVFDSLGKYTRLYIKSNIFQFDNNIVSLSEEELIAIIRTFVKTVRKHAYIENEKDAIMEMGHFIYNKEDYRYESQSGFRNERVLARAIAIFVSKSDIELPTEKGEQRK